MIGFEFGLSNKEDAVRIVSLNAWGGRLFDPLMRMLRQLNADVYCLQEVFDSSSEGFYSDEVKGYRTGDPLIRANFFDEVQKALPGHRGLMHPACRWEIQDVERLQDLPCYFGIATFVRKDMPVHEVRSGFVFEEFRALPRTELPTPRVAVALRLTDPTTAHPFVVAHMHGLWIPEGKHDTPHRIKQAEEFCSLIEGVARVGDSVVACGDFNVLPDSETFKILRGLTDLVVASGSSSTRSALYTERQDKRGLPAFADYMLVSPVVKVKNFQIIRDEVVSDHCPLVLDC